MSVSHQSLSVALALTLSLSHRCLSVSVSLSSLSLCPCLPLIAVSVARPFEKAKFNRLEGLSLVTSFVIFFSGQFFYLKGFIDEAQLQFVSFFIACSFLVFLLCCVFMFFRLGLKQWDHAHVHDVEDDSHIGDDEPPATAVAGAGAVAGAITAVAAPSGAASPGSPASGAASGASVPDIALPLHARSLSDATLMPVEEEEKVNAAPAAPAAAPSALASEIELANLTANHPNSSSMPQTSSLFARSPLAATNSDAMVSGVAASPSPIPPQQEEEAAASAPVAVSEAAVAPSEPASPAAGSADVLTMSEFLRNSGSSDVVTMSEFLKNS